jgi:hypothetical protein
LRIVEAGEIVCERGALGMGRRPESVADGAFGHANLQYTAEMTSV